jgi:hypothetical protein
VDGTTWTDPRYADVVAAWDRMAHRRLQQGPVRPCPSCQHGLGTVMMVDLTTRKPITMPCPRCPAG